MEKEDQSTGRTRLVAVVISKQADAIPRTNKNLPGLRIQLLLSPCTDLQAGQNRLQVRISQPDRRKKRGQACNFSILYYFQASSPLFDRGRAHLGISLFQ